jgi:hypothetical protein
MQVNKAITVPSYSKATSHYVTLSVHKVRTAPHRQNNRTLPQHTSHRQDRPSLITATQIINFSSTCQWLQQVPAVCPIANTHKISLSLSYTHTHTHTHKLRQNSRMEILLAALLKTWRCWMASSAVQTELCPTDTNCTTNSCCPQHNPTSHWTVPCRHYRGVKIIRLWSKKLLVTSFICWRYLNTECTGVNTW